MPTGRERPGADSGDPGDPAPAAVAAYAAGHDDLVLAGAEAVELVTSLLDEAGINYLTVSGRTKSVASFAEKAVRVGRRRAALRRPAARDRRPARGPRHHLRPRRRRRGRRRSWPTRSSSTTTATSAARPPARDGSATRAATCRSRSTPRARASRRTPTCAGRNVQVQIRTVLQHAWAEFEHDIRYKGTVPPEHAHDFDRRFTLAAGLLELADQEFATIRDRLRGPVTQRRPPRAGHARRRPAPRRARARGVPGRPVRRRRLVPQRPLRWVSGLLLELGITSLDELGEVLRATDEAADPRADGLPLPARRRTPARRRPARDVRRRRYVELHGNAHRAAALRARLDKLTPSHPRIGAWASRSRRAS